MFGGSDQMDNDKQLQYAIKQILIPEIDTHYADQEDELIELQMINREFDSLTKLDHPLIAELLEVFLDQNFVYFVSPFYTGGEIHDMMYD